MTIEINECNESLIVLLKCVLNFHCCAGWTLQVDLPSDQSGRNTGQVCDR